MVLFHLFIHQTGLANLSCNAGLGATLNVAKPPKGSTVAIFGLGAVGLAVSFCNSLFYMEMLFLY